MISTSDKRPTGQAFGNIGQNSGIRVSVALN